MIAVFCFNLLGDGLRDIVDPSAEDVMMKGIILHTAVVAGQKRERMSSRCRPGHPSIFTSVLFKDDGPDRVGGDDR